MANDEKRISPVDEAQLLRAACCDWRLSRGDLGCLAVMLEHCDSDWNCYPGPERIGKLARLAKTNVKASIARLEKLKFVAVHRPGPRKKNRFTILETPACPSRKARDMLRNLGKHFGESGLAGIPSSDQTTGRAGMRSTGRAGMSQLGMPARQEVAFKAPKEITCASPPEEQERSPEEQAKHIASIRQTYMCAVTTQVPGVMQQLEERYREHLTDLITGREAA